MAETLVPCIAHHGFCYPQNPCAFIHSLNKHFSSTFTVPRDAKGNRRKEQLLLTACLQGARPCDRCITCDYSVTNNL